MKLFVYHTPEQTPAQTLPDCAIAIDVLRATSTIASALAAGAEAVQVFDDMQKLMQVSEQWSSPLRLRAGERGGAKVEGCDLGNSPLDCTPELMTSKRLFISTTNGTRCLVRVQKAPIVLTAALINRQAVVDYLCKTNPEIVWILGSGWEGSYALEDTVCAGAIAHQLQVQMKLTTEEIAGNDEVVAAIALYQQWQDQLLKLLHLASHGQRLLRLNCQEDLAYCAALDTLDIVPIQKEAGVLIKSN